MNFLSVLCVMLDDLDDTVDETWLSTIKGMYSTCILHVGRHRIMSLQQ